MGRIHRQMQGGRNGNRSLVRQKVGKNSREHKGPKSQRQLAIYRNTYLVDSARGETIQIDSFKFQDKDFFLFKDLVQIPDWGG